MNVYWQELRSSRKSTIIWTSSLIALALVYFAVYPGVAKDAEGFVKLLEGYPPAVRSMLGISIENIATLLGYYSMVFAFVALFGAVQAMNLGMRLLSREVQAGTVDFLLSKPVSRGAVLRAKLFAAISALLCTNILYSAATYSLANLVKTADFSSETFFMMNMTLLFLQIFFLALGVLASTLLTRLRSILPVSLGTVFGLYFVGALLATEKGSIMRYFSPFKYFDTAYILQHGKFEAHYLYFGAVIIIFAVLGGFLLYIKRDARSIS